MVVAVLAALVGLVTVLVACYHRDAALDPPPDPDPGWDPLPAPNDVARPAFPTAFPGYDPAAVDATIEALLVAYEELWSAAGPAARERARRTAARRRGVEDAVTVAHRDEGPGAEPRPDGAEPSPPRAGRTAVPEALRAAAALAALQRAQDRP